VPTSDVPAGAVLTRPLGRTALAVTELGFGSAPIGNLFTALTDATATDAVDTAWRCGIRYFDTAPQYGHGLAERRLGAALAARPRDEFVVSTKVGRLVVPNTTGRSMAEVFAIPDDTALHRDYSADGVRRSLDASLQRLGLDRVDIVLVHDPDDFVDQAIGETIPALVRLRDEGVIGAVGVGMNQWQAPLRMVEQTDVDVVMIAGRWTLIDRSAAPLLAACRERGVGVLAAAPYNSGLLATDEPRADATFDYQPADRQKVELARGYAALAAQHGVTLPELAVQFPLRDPATTAVVAGMRTPDEVRACVARLQRAVPDAAWQAVGRSHA